MSQEWAEYCTHSGTASRKRYLYAFQARYRRVNDIRLRRYGIVFVMRYPSEQTGAPGVPLSAFVRK